MPGLCNAPSFLAIDAHNPMRLFLACWPRVLEGRECWGGLYRSEDAGASWKNVYDSASHVYGVALDSRHPTHVYYTNFENMALFSMDNGDHFERLQGYDFKWAHQPVLHPARDGRLYVATFGSGLWLFDSVEET
jgi:hypothetical protein